MATINYTQAAEDYTRIEQAILFLEANFRDQPDLKTVADKVGLSEYHFQRLFTRWAGISPKRFVQFLTLEYAKNQLSDSKSVLDVTYDAGLSSTGRLHDLFVTYEAMTPGEYKNQGEGLLIRYGFQPTPFGEALLAVTDRGLCGLAFVQNGDQAQVLAELYDRWPQAEFQADQAGTEQAARQIFPANGDQRRAVKLLMKGTPFQLKVWQALLDIPHGALVSYNDVAERIGQPQAARAVGRAVACNPIGFVIPCHRVIRKVGAVDGYHWGTTRKRAIIGWEAAQQAISIAE
jgi:AraC family transcriptional regulator of adaptative response/methylated-DNA-[protein]-cysteine methyltransferase